MELDPQYDGNPDPEFGKPDMDVSAVDATGTVRILAANTFTHEMDPDPGHFNIQESSRNCTKGIRIRLIDNIF